MNNPYEMNGIVSWNEFEIRLRNMMSDYFYHSLKDALLKINHAWTFHQVEMPILLPQEFINHEYNDENMFHIDPIFRPDEDRFWHLYLRPETTYGSYIHAQNILTEYGTKEKLPICIWQIGKSFRLEQNQPTKFMRLKEFYQQEFQCIYSIDTGMDYHGAIIRPVELMIRDMVLCPIKVLISDRLPKYSETTVDIEAQVDDRWLELCSISRRTDYPWTVPVNIKAGKLECKVLVLEISIGLDRCVWVRTN